MPLQSEVLRIPIVREKKVVLTRLSDAEWMPMKFPPKFRYFCNAAFPASSNTDKEVRNIWARKLTVDSGTKATRYLGSGSYVPSPVVLKNTMASNPPKIRSVNWARSSVATKFTFMKGALLYRASIAVGIESCRNPAVAEYMRTRAGTSCATVVQIVKQPAVIRVMWYNIKFWRESQARMLEQQGG